MRFLFLVPIFFVLYTFIYVPASVDNINEDFRNNIATYYAGQGTLLKTESVGPFQSLIKIPLVKDKTWFVIGSYDSVLPVYLLATTKGVMVVYSPPPGIPAGTPMTLEYWRNPQALNKKGDTDTDYQRICYSNFGNKVCISVLETDPMKFDAVINDI
ncbi:TPA: hypothetical protein U6I48_004818 [Klebsiella aerogenes]|nr:hypothetical protein [Klebsiella aerogenes]